MRYLRKNKVRVDYVKKVDGTIGANPFSVLRNAAELAIAEGAETLIIEGTTASPKLLSAMRRWGVVTEGANERIIIYLDDYLGLAR